MNSIIVGDKNTSTSPKSEYVIDLVAPFIFSSSPKESMNLNPDIIKDITTITTENEMAKFITKNTNSVRFSYPVLFKTFKSINIRVYIKIFNIYYNTLSITNLTRITEMKQTTNPTIAYVKDFVAFSTFPSSPAAVM